MKYAFEIQLPYAPACGWLRSPHPCEDRATAWKEGLVYAENAFASRGEKLAVQVIAIEDAAPIAEPAPVPYEPRQRPAPPMRRKAMAALLNRVVQAFTVPDDLSRADAQTLLDDARNAARAYAPDLEA